MKQAQPRTTIANEDIEIHLLLEALYLKYGYDFRHYSRAHIKRRLLKRLAQEKAESMTHLTWQLLNSRSLLQKILSDFSINATEMFRDPDFFKHLSSDIFPVLQTYPQIRIWVAGCASGEEVYSLSILLKEYGLYEKSMIYATDFNDKILEVAKQGIYPIDLIKPYTRNYLASGGKGSLSDYYTAGYDSVAMSKELKKNVTFANHNLTADGVFSQMHLILCRNVMIYFDRPLKNRALKLFHESLENGCFLCVGMKESLTNIEDARYFDPYLQSHRIYRKR